MGHVNVNWSDQGGRKKLKNITDYFNITQLIEQPTRITNRSETKTDLLFTNKPERITKTFNLMTESRFSENSEFVNPEMRETLGFLFQKER